VRFTSKPTKNNQRYYVTKNNQFMSKLAKVLDALTQEGSCRDVDVIDGDGDQ
jgi:hypothetical protein